MSEEGFDRDEFYIAALARELDLQARSTPLPPWLKYPDIPRYSIGWRMGAGESYLMVFWHWSERQSHAELLAYFREFAPLQLEWVDWVGMQLEDAERADQAEADQAEADQAEQPSLEDLIRRAGERIADLGLFDVEAWRAYLRGE